jgi:hypothetical protein
LQLRFLARLSLKNTAKSHNFEELVPFFQVIKSFFTVELDCALAVLHGNNSAMDGILLFSPAGPGAQEWHSYFYYYKSQMPVLVFFVILQKKFIERQTQIMKPCSLQASLFVCWQVTKFKTQRHPMITCSGRLIFLKLSLHCAFLLQRNLLMHSTQLLAVMS